jgi:hypothetical protein
VSFHVAWKILGGAVLLAILGTAAAITYINHTRPTELGLASATPRSPAPSPSPEDPFTTACPKAPSAGGSTTGVAGLWIVQPGSLAGYRAREKFAELTSPHEAVARTDRLTGWLLIGDEGGTLALEGGCVAVDVRTLQSIDELPGFNTRDRDQNARDFLNTSAHPFVIFQPDRTTLHLDAAGTAAQHATLTGVLEISGVTKHASFKMDVRLKDGQVSAAGRTTVDVGQFGVEVPQEAGGFVRVNPNIVLEVSLILVRS